jgi:periplasmic divalent cation tolerance protein
MVILCTCPDNKTAKRIAHKLVGDRLAACVNIIPGIESIYTWQNKIESSQEYLLLIKTNQDTYVKLEAIIKKEHPYECPEIIALPIQDGSQEYLQWLDKTIIMG